MINQESYLKLKEHFADIASWAIWDTPIPGVPKSNMRSVAMFDDEAILDSLNPNFVFIGLNGSGVHDDYMDMSSPWHNFHSSNPHGHDYKLRYALLDTPYWGSYITDVIKRLPEVDSSKVAAYLNNHPQIITKSIHILSEEIEILGTHPTLICLGTKSYEIVKKHLGDRFTVKKIMHYSYQIGKEDYRAHVLKTLSGSDAQASAIQAQPPQVPWAQIPKIDPPPFAQMPKIDFVPLATTQNQALAASLPSLEKHLTLTELDIPKNWGGDNRDQLLLLLQPLLDGTDFCIRKNITDTSKNGLNMFHKNEPRRCMGFEKTKNMGFLVYPTTAFYNEIRHKAKMPEPDPKKKQPHMKMTLAEFWEFLYNITR